MGVTCRAKPDPEDGRVPQGWGRRPSNERLLSTLNHLGLVREFRAKRDMPAFRHEPDTGQAFAPIITDLGRSVLQTAKDKGAPDSLLGSVDKEDSQAG